MASPSNNGRPTTARARTPESHDVLWLEPGSEPDRGSLGASKSERRSRQNPPNPPRKNAGGSRPRESTAAADGLQGPAPRTTVRPGRCEPDGPRSTRELSRGDVQGRTADVAAAGSRDWTDDVESMVALLAAAGVCDLAPGMRRRIVNDLVSRRATPSDLLTWIQFHVARGRGPGWLFAALTRNPETIWLARSSGAEPLVAGRVDEGRAKSIGKLLDRVSNRRKA